jgi:hypothetical protein
MIFDSFLLVSRRVINMIAQQPPQFDAEELARSCGWASEIRPVENGGLYIPLFIGWVDQLSKIGGAGCRNQPHNHIFRNIFLGSCIA